jgi:hypothetical protein
MGALRIIGFVLVGIAVFLGAFILEGSNDPLAFLLWMIIPNVIVGTLLIVAKEKSGYPE